MQVIDLSHLLHEVSATVELVVIAIIRQREHPFRNHFHIIVLNKAT